MIIVIITILISSMPVSVYCTSWTTL